MTRYALGVLAYLVPTFALGFVWHLVLFRSYYEALAIYRADMIVPFGFVAMLIQGAFFAWVHARAFAEPRGNLLRRSWRYGCAGAALSWSFTTLAVAAKNVMASVPDYLVIETSFTVIQWALVAPLTVLAMTWRRDTQAVGDDQRQVAGAG
jgi:hypothetical protein